MTTETFVGEQAWWNCRAHWLSQQLLGTYSVLGTPWGLEMLQWTRCLHEVLMLAKLTLCWILEMLHIKIPGAGALRCKWSSEEAGEEATGRGRLEGTVVAGLSGRPLWESAISALSIRDLMERLSPGEPPNIGARRDLYRQGNWGRQRGRTCFITQIFTFCLHELGYPLAQR